MVEDAARDSIRYLEVRYCPWLSRRQGLSMERALEAELAGLARGERDFGVVTRVINCSLRHYDPAVSLEIARLSVAYRDRGVVAFDLAGRRGGPARRVRTGPPSTPRWRATSASRCTPGEAAGAESIAEAICRTATRNRIGHGTRLYEDPALRDYVRDRRILLEINITSNVQTHAVARRRGSSGAASTSTTGWRSPSAPTAGSCAASRSATSTGWPTPRSASPARRSTA